MLTKCGNSKSEFSFRTLARKLSIGDAFYDPTFLCESLSPLASKAEIQMFRKDESSLLTSKYLGVSCT